MTSITFENINKSPVDICNAAGVTLKRLNLNKKWTVNTTKHGMPLYFKRVYDGKVTDHYTYCNGNFVIDTVRIRSKDGTAHFKPFRDSVLNLAQAQKVANIFSALAKKK